MGYIFIILSLMAGLLKGFCGKKISGMVSTLKGIFYMNTFRMLMCIVIGFFIILPDGISSLAVDFKTLIIPAVSGIATALFVVSWIFCVRRGAYVMVDVFLMLGSALTFGLCKIFFDEPVLLKQMIGFILLLIASYFMCSYSSNIKGGFSFSSFLLLVVSGALNGIADFAQKWFVYSQPDGNVAVFNFYTYLFASIVLLVCYAISSKTEKAQNDAKSLRICIVICIMAVCLFAYSYFKTMAAGYIPSVILYPITSGASIVLSALMAAIFFNEKLKPKCIIGIIIAITAIVVMNF